MSPWDNADERPRSIPEMRGMQMNAEARERERNREKPYSANSYAAQYGITVEDAQELRGRFNSHPRIVREITTMFARDPELRTRALMLGDAEPLTAEEEEHLTKILRGALPDMAMGRGV